MKIQTAVELVRRFADQAAWSGATALYPPSVLRRLLAAATTGHVAVWRVTAFSADGQRDNTRSSVLSPPAARASWPEVVFHYNGAALAEIERVPDVSCHYAVELLAREAYFAGRTYLPLDERSEEELEWELSSLDSSLAMAQVAAEVLPTALDLERLTILRATIAARRGAR